MFKWTGKSGRRSAGGGGANSSGRVSGLHGLRGSDTTVSRRRRPAFMPDTPEQQGFDGKNSRLHGLED